MRCNQVYYIYVFVSVVGAVIARCCFGGALSLSADESYLVKRCKALSVVREMLRMALGGCL